MNYPISCNPIKDIMDSFDGTWMKRGYKSKYGIAFVIEYFTGLVLPTRMLIMTESRNTKLNVVKTMTDILVAWR